MANTYYVIEAYDTYFCGNDERGEEIWHESRRGAMRFPTTSRANRLILAWWCNDNYVRTVKVRRG